MKIYNQPRCSGKTTRLVYESAMKQIPILCYSWCNAENIERYAKEIGLNIPEPICIEYLFNEVKDEFGNNIKPLEIAKRTVNGVLIDEGVIIFQKLLAQFGIYANKIDSVTMTYPDEE